MDKPSPSGASESNTAGALVRPPALFLATFLAGLGLDYVLPLPVTDSPLAATLGATLGLALCLIGLTVFVLGIRNFMRADTPVQGTRPTVALVVTGIHGWSRNPIYVGMFLIYLGLGIAVLSPWVLALLLPLAAVMHYGVVLREEVYLERLFGEAYVDYRAKVPRWL